MKAKYPHADQLRLIFTDTDSLAYAVETNDIYGEYPLNHPLYDTSNRKALGFFKDELNSVPMGEFVGLRPKCYAFLCTGKVDKNAIHHSNPVEKKTAKGIKRKVKDEHLHFNHYLDAFHNFSSSVCDQNLVFSTSHTVHSLHQRKVDLTAFDTKRWLCEDTIHTHTRMATTTLLNFQMN